jgi:ATP-dependent helicase HrpB
VTPLPIDSLLPEIQAALRTAPSIVLEAAPGAGKTTRVPAALLDLVPGEIVVSEPRRLPARLAARFVAEERSERVGETIGYSVRFEDVSSARTRVRYVSEGVLLRRLLGDRELRGVSVVVLDEFHERHLATDLALTLLLRLQRSTRPDLKLIVMSATLDAEPVSRFLPGAVRFRSEGRVFPIEIEHLEKADDRPLERQIASAVRRLGTTATGDVLAFLPGAGDIRRASEALAASAAEQDWLVLPLHGELSIEQQARAIQRAERRKIILSTNVAESSVTIDGVTTVIDSGLARVAGYSPWTGLPTLTTARISRASAAQRAGRAGRTAPGRVFRLYTRGDLGTRPEHDAPEIERLDLSEAALLLHGTGVSDPSQLDWLTPPPATTVAAAEALLNALGALDRAGALSAVGERMLRLPLHPRLARVVVEGEARGVARDACLAAALLAERDIRATARARLGGGARRRYDASGPSDVLELMELFYEAEESRFSQHALRSLELDPRAVQSVDKARRQLARACKTRSDQLEDEAAREQALGLCLLAGFPDRLARRRRAGERDLVLVNGTLTKLSEDSVVHQAPLLVALDVDEQRHGRSASATVRLASAVEPEWLLEIVPHAIDETHDLEWNASLGRVDRVTRTTYGSITLDESRAPASPSPESAAVLARAMIATRPSPIEDQVVALERLKLRLDVLTRHAAEAGNASLATADLAALIATACHGLTSAAELRGVDLRALLLAQLPVGLEERLRRDVPERITLPSGRQLVVHYEPDRPPWVESRLQDFFGMTDALKVCGGRVALTLHLLAPSQRAVQVTSDLAGFWERHYPAIRRELMRQYPRHSWPEDGRTATPPPPNKRR